MTTLSRYSFVLMLCLAMVATPALAGDFQDCQLDGAMDAGQMKMLGVDKTPFNLSEIKAEFVLLEFFSMYCPVCQRSAKDVNTIFDRITQRGLGNRIAMVGIGSGNTPFEVQLYQEKYDVKFPLFPDEEFTIVPGKDRLATPYFLLLKNGQPEPTPVYTHIGEVEDVEALYHDLMAAIGEK